MISVGLFIVWAIIAIALCSWSLSQNGGWGGIVSLVLLFLFLIFELRREMGGKGGKGKPEKVTPAPEARRSTVDESASAAATSTRSKDVSKTSSFTKLPNLDDII
jgi:hypothetical protein